MAENIKSPATPATSITHDDNDSNWEDQNTSDDNRLKIDEPKKKKVRRKRSSHSKIHVPDDILKECSHMLDNTLDNKARSLNLSATHVKMVLKSVIQSPELLGFGLLMFYNTIHSFLKGLSFSHVTKRRRCYF